MVAGISLFMAILLQQTGYFERSIGYISAMTISLAVAMYFAFKNESNKSDSEEINN